MAKRDHAWGRLIAALFIAGNTMVLSLVVNITDASPAERYRICLVVMLGTLLVAVLAGQALGRQLLQACRTRRLGIEGLFASGIAGATCYSAVSLWRGEGAIYFEVVGILLAVYGVATQVKQVGQDRLHEALRTALPDADRARRLSPGGEPGPMVSVGDVAVGDQVEVRPGELIPVDGIIDAGSAYVNEATLTGEGFCVSRKIGDSVQAGSRNLDGLLHVRAARSGSERGLDTLFEQLRGGHLGRSRLESHVDRLARWFFPCVAVLSLGTFGVWLVRGDVTAAFLNAMAVLLVACPCALGFATPIGLWTSIVRLAHLGIHTRNATAIERLARVDSMIFDKTGTLCAVAPLVKKIIVLPQSRYSEDWVAAMVQTAQQLSDHPIARAFASLPPTSKKVAYKPRRLRILPGCGIEVQFIAPPHTCTIGDITRLASPLDIARAEQFAAACCDEGRTIGIFIDANLCAIAKVVDRPIGCATHALKRLTAQGIHCTICSGDRSGRLEPWQGFYATGDMTPSDKAAQVRDLRSSGRTVCFVGDGYNDAPAMACSDVSIAVAGGAPLAVALADFSLPQECLNSLPEVTQICRQTLRMVRTNLIFAAFYNVVGVTVAAMGLLHPVFAAILMVCASLGVTVRSASLLSPGTGAIHRRAVKRGSASASIRLLPSVESDLSQSSGSRQQAHDFTEQKHVESLFASPTRDTS